MAVLAELVAWRHGRGGPGLAATALEAVDPVCGMTVAVSPETPTAEYAGIVYRFCCPGCRGRFARDPERFLATS